MDDAPRPLPDALAAALVFLASGAVLVLELLGLRLLAPYVGVTIGTTTAIIGSVLGGIALGASLGGRAADRGGGRRLVASLFVAGGLLALATVPLVRTLGDAVRGEGDGGALLVTLVALLPGAAVLSAVTPVVVRLQVSDLRLTGTVVGSLSAWATAGALVGTFGTGFVLVPLLPSSTSVLAVGAVLTAIGVALGARAAGVLGGAAVLAAGTALAGTECDAETTYHCAKLERAGSVTTLVLDDLRHSAVDLDDPRRLVFDYTQWLAASLPQPASRPLDVVFVGGGGLTLPRHLAATRPGTRSLVLEVDDRLVDLVRERLPLRDARGITVRTGDARVTLRDEPGASRDVVVGDAFGSLAVPWHLTTVEWLREVQRVLRPGGLYAMNLIDRRGLEFAAAQLATLRAAFGHVALVGRPGTSPDRPAPGNLVLLASDRPLPAGRPWRGARAFPVAPLAAGADVLTDDDAPAEQLLRAGGAG